MGLVIREKLVLCPLAAMQGQLSPCLRAAQSPASSNSSSKKWWWRHRRNGGCSVSLLRLAVSLEPDALGAKEHFGMLSDAQFGKMFVSEPLARFL